MTNLVLNELPVHMSAQGYVRLRSILSNVRVHSHFAYSVRVDLSNFFPSIRPEDVLQVVERRMGKLSPQAAQFITDALFVEYRSGCKGLAVGAPSSPAASNAVMFGIDSALTAFAIARNGCYTRYADDLVFSTDSKGESARFVEEVDRVLSTTLCPRLHINRRKTSYSSRATRRVITGLVVTPDSAVSVGRRNKRFVRKLLFDLSENRLDSDSSGYLQGYLGFLKGVEPDVLNKFALRYGAGLLDRARGGVVKPR